MHNSDAISQQCRCTIRRVLLFNYAIHTGVRFRYDIATDKRLPLWLYRRMVESQNCCTLQRPNIALDIGYFEHSDYGLFGHRIVY